MKKVNNKNIEPPYKLTLNLKYLIESIENDHFIDQQTKTLILKEVQENPEIMQDMSFDEENGRLCTCEDMVKRIINLVFPPLSMDTDYVAAVTPFKMETVFASPLFSREFLNSENQFTGRISEDEELSDVYIKGCAILILKQLYHKTIDINKIKTLFSNDPASISDLKYFFFSVDDKYCKVIDHRPEEQLTPEELTDLLKNFHQVETVLKYFPADKYEFKGIMLLRGLEVTTEIIISGIKERLLKEKSIANKKLINYLNGSLQVLLNNPDISIGLSLFKNKRVYLLDDSSDFKHENIYLDSIFVSLITEIPPVIKTVRDKNWTIVTDTMEQQIKDDDMYLGHLTSKNTGSCALFALKNHGDFFGVFELRSKKKNDISFVDIKILKDLVPYAAIIIQRRMDELDNKVERVLREKCTAIHPSLEWKFNEVAFDYLFNANNQVYEDLPDINFNNVYPLYAASDIKSSSTIRNEAIQTDLLSQLTRIKEILNKSYKFTKLEILHKLKFEIKQKMKEIEQELSASDEGRILKYLKLEILPHFEHFKSLNQDIKNLVLEYEKLVNPESGLIYNKRKIYEDSVISINHSLSKFLDFEQNRIQKLIPHYFDKAQTDGVDHNIYVGESLYKEANHFNELSLQNVRLWQLRVVTMSAVIADLVRQNLEIPLEVAHIIVAQSTPLNIRFHYDEKKLNVDGAYNARYEIMKKRIDKATIRETDERLTAPGHVAIVYTHDNEYYEYEGHINYLKNLGYVESDLEVFELNDLQGISGLRAIRFKVDLKNVCMGLENYLKKYDEHLLKEVKKVA